MEDSMIEQPCGGCGRVWCNCPPDDEDEDVSLELDWWDEELRQ